MKILAIYRHYWPDTTPYARLLRMILERLAAEGHDVSAFTAQPSYNGPGKQPEPWEEQLGGVEVRRVALLPEHSRAGVFRLINSCLFLLRAILHATLWKRYDILLANSQPPVLIGLALRCIARLTGARYILHAQDIHPEVMSAIGEKPVAAGWLRRLEADSCAKAARVVTLSRDMRDALNQRCKPVAPISVINNCPPASFVVSSGQDPIRLGSPDRVQLLFAGNLGRFQAIDQIASATQLAACRDELMVTFMGDGVAAEGLRAGYDPGVVRLIPRQPAAIAQAAMEQADYGIVSLSAGVIRYAYPSKTLSYLAAGLPLLLIVDNDSELAEMVTKNRLGVVARATTAEAIADALDEAVARRGEWTAARRAEIVAFVECQAGAERMLDAWADLLRQLDPTSPTAVAGEDAPRLGEAA